MNVGNVWVTFTLVDHFSDKLFEITTAMNHLGRAQRQWGLNMSLFGATMSAAITAPMLAMVKAAADFENEFSNVVKTVDGLDVEEFGKLNTHAQALRESLRGMARELPFTHKQLSQIAAFGGQFGVASEDLGKFTEVVAKLGTAVDGIETETAAKGLAQIISITTPGKISENIEKLASELVHLGNTGISTEGTILEITRRMAGAGKTAGMSANFMMGLSAAVANLGHRSELGGTALANTVLKIDRAVSRGGEALHDFARVAKMSSDEFQKSWGRDSEKTLMKLFSELGQLNPKNLSSAIADLFGTAARHNQVLLSLISAYPLLVHTLEQGNKAWNESAALQEEFRKKAITVVNQLQVLQNRLYDVAITIGGVFLEAIHKNIDSFDPWITKLKELADSFAKMDPGSQRFIVNSTLIAAVLPVIAGAIGIVTWTIGQFSGVLTGIGRLILWLLPTLQGTGEAVSGWSIAWGGLRSVLTAIINPIGRLITFIISLLPGMGGLSAVATSLSGVFTVLSGIFLALAPVLAVISGFFMALLTDIRSLGIRLGIITPRMHDGVTTFESFKNVVKDLISPLGILDGKLKTIAEKLGLIGKIDKWTFLLGPGAPLGRAFEYFVKGPDFGDPFAKDMGEGGRLAGFNQPKYVQKDGEAYLVSMIQKYRTNMDIINDVEKKTNETAMTLWQSASNRVNDYTGEAEKAAKKTKELEDAARLLEEAFDRGVEFQKIFGFDDFSKFTLMNEQFKKMQELNMEAPLVFLNDFGQAAKGAIEWLKANGYVVPKLFYDIYSAYGQKNFVDIIKNLKGLGDTAEEVFSLWDEQDKFKSNIFGLQIDLVAARQNDDAMKSTLNAYKELINVQNELANKERPKSLDPAVWKQFIDLTNQLNYEKLMRVVRGTKAFAGMMSLVALASPAAARGIKEVFDALGDLDKKDPEKKDPIKFNFDNYKKGVKELAGAFTKLSQIMGDSFGGPLKAMAEMVGFMNVALEVSESLVMSFENIKGAFDGGKFNAAQFIAGAVQMVMAITQAIAVLNAATNVAGRGQRMLSGAATGASLMAKTGNAYAIVGGAIVGAIWGAVRKLDWEEVGKRIGDRLGVSISKGLSDKIAKTADSMFGGDWMTAEVYHMADIIADVGGLTEKNSRTFLKMMRDSFALMEMGKMSASDVAKVLETFPQFLERGTDQMGFISRELREIITLSYKFGVQSKEILAYMTEQGDLLLEQVEALAQMPAKYNEWISIGERIKKANETISEAADDTSKIAEANRDLEAALRDQAAAAEIAQQELHDLGIIIAGNIFAAVADGRSLTQAIMAAKDGLQKFFAAYTALGILPDDPIVQMLYNQNALVQAIPNVINGVDALGQTIVGLSNMNLLTEDSFESIQRAGYNAYVAIQGEIAKVGGSTRDALLPMQDYLRRAERAATELGIPLDENTQMLIDQSKELGIWKSLGPSAMELMTSKVGDLVTKIGELIDKMFGIPTELPNPFRNWTLAEDPSSVGFPAAPRKGDPSDQPDAFDFSGTPTNSSNSVFSKATSTGPTTVPVVMNINNHKVFADIVLEQADQTLALRGVRR